MDPQQAPVEKGRETPNADDAAKNIARFVKEHEVAAVRRNMHIYEEGQGNSDEE
jgi:hypothetical protein